MFKHYNVSLKHGNVNSLFFILSYIKQSQPSSEKETLAVIWHVILLTTQKIPLQFTCEILTVLWTDGCYHFGFYKEKKH